MAVTEPRAVMRATSVAFQYDAGPSPAVRKARTS